MNDKPFTVTEINSQIKSLFDSNSLFQNIRIEGEISNFKPSSSGHYYFQLKDDRCQLSANMWRGVAASIDPEIFKNLKDGTSVIVTGSVEVYEVGGRYNLIVKKIELEGLGSLWQKFEELKKKLQQKGYFEKNNKQQLPRFNYDIGIITSPTGAVIEDIRTTLQRRCPFVTVTLYPVPVQGKGAEVRITDSLEKADNNNHDVIIIARGGGSIEDLWPFNEEVLADKIFAAKTPIISAIGHESDFTISDFVADVRAATPTAAAELVNPSIKEIKQLLLSYQNIDIQMEKVINTKLLEYTGTTEIFTRLRNTFVKNIQQKIINLDNLLSNSMSHNLKETRHLLSRANQRLDDLNPNNILKRGYAIPMIGDKVLKSIDQIIVNAKNVNQEDLKIKIIDGEIKAKILEIEKVREKKYE